MAKAIQTRVNVAEPTRAAHKIQTHFLSYSRISFLLSALSAGALYEIKLGLTNTSMTRAPIRCNIISKPIKESENEKKKGNESVTSKNS
jgi:hypothetical protein